MNDLKSTIETMTKLVDSHENSANPTFLVEEKTNAHHWGGTQMRQELPHKIPISLDDDNKQKEKMEQLDSRRRIPIKVYDLENSNNKIAVGQDMRPYVNNSVESSSDSSPSLDLMTDTTGSINSIKQFTTEEVEDDDMNDLIKRRNNNPAFLNAQTEENDDIFNPLRNLTPPQNPEIITESIIENEENGIIPLDEDKFKLPPMEHEIIGEGVYKWVISDWSSTYTLTKAFSPTFEIGGQKWRILMFPHGNNTDSLALYLDNVEHPSSTEGNKMDNWSCCSQFSLSLQNPYHPNVILTRDTHHRFNATECDWGFTHFIKLSNLMKTIPMESISSISSLGGEKESKPFVEADKLYVFAHVRIIKDVTGNLWHSFINYDSRKETGYVGLKNQGATCYMNSLLQSLFFIDFFRKATFQIPTENDDVRKSIPLALQRLFYQLQTSPQPVSTTELTKSFGWDSYESFLQRDVQEFSRKLMESLEAKMKGTPSEGALDKLFMGQTRRFVKCLHVDYESSGTESFYDIPLSVKGMKDVYDSFHSFVATEILDGDNKYRAEGFGLQVAKIGVVFTKFPPVLHLQLKRFEYDMMRDMTVKVNDRYEFPLKMNLGEFIAEDSPDKHKQTYHLYGVLVHSGDVGGGHYYAFMKEHATGKWLKFDDDRVIYVTEKEAVEDNFGGEYDSMSRTTGMDRLSRDQQINLTKKNAIKKFTNAYMLVYIREDDIKDVLSPLKDLDIPKHLAEQCNKERIEEEQRRQEKAQQYLYLNLKLVTDDFFKDNEGPELIEPVLEEAPNIKMLKEKTILELKEYIFQEHKIPVRQQRYWIVKQRVNGSKRPAEPILDEFDAEELRKLLPNERTNEILLYLEIGLGHYPLVSITKQTILLFVKFFDPLKQKLEYLHHVYGFSNRPFSEVLPQLRELAELPANCPLLVYEEVKAFDVQQLVVSKSCHDLALQHGDIIVFQRDPGSTVPKGSPKHLNQLIPTFYEFLANRVDVSFQLRPKEEQQSSTYASSMSSSFDKENVNAPDSEKSKLLGEFKIELSRTMTYDEVSEKLASNLNVDPQHIRFTTYDPILSGPRTTPLKYNSRLTLGDMLSRTYYMNPVDIIYYEILEVPILEMESKKCLKISLTEDKKEEKVVQILVPFTATVEDVLKVLRSKLLIPSLPVSPLIPLESNQIHSSYMEKPYYLLLEVSNHHIVKEYKEKDSILGVGEYSTLILHRLSESELSAIQGESGDRYIRVFHFYKDLKHSYGTPFKFLLKKGEPFIETKKKLGQFLGMSDRELNRCRFALVGTGKPPQYIEPGEDDSGIPNKGGSEAGTDSTGSPMSTSSVSGSTGDWDEINSLILAEYDWTSSDQLGIDHPNKKSLQSGRIPGHERAIKIHN